MCDASAMACMKCRAHAGSCLGAIRPGPIVADDLKMCIRTGVMTVSLQEFRLLPFMGAQSLHGSVHEQQRICR